MAKSRNRKDHKQKLANYKATKKREQDALKKRMIEQYMKIQQEALAAQEAHTSTQEVEGPEINIDELNEIETDVNIDVPIDIDQSIVDNPDISK